jgi:glycosyltransferase involved in cell wall biosynthesis
MTESAHGLCDDITAVIITFNEAPNIGRTLDGLTWANQVIIVDSFSDDETLEIAARYPNVTVHQRRFDNPANQFNHAMQDMGVTSEWIFAIDADYVVTEAFVQELTQLNPGSEISGYECFFDYCVMGRPLRSGIYPPRISLFRRTRGTYWQDAHTQRLKISGEIKPLTSKILHDDRKSLDRWFDSQLGYARREARKLLKSSGANLGFTNRVRNLRFVAPLLVTAHCLIVRRGLLDGRRGIFYAFQRGFAELLLALHLINSDLHSKDDE